MPMKTIGGRVRLQAWAFLRLRIEDPGLKPFALGAVSGA
jgi:hypothetical protein